MEEKRKRAVVLAGLSGCMWGSIGLFVHLLGSFGIRSIELTVGRFLVSAVILGLCLMVKRKLLVIRLRDLPLFAAAGICCLLFFNVSYGIAIEKASMSVAAVMLYTSPALVMLISAVVFREALTIQKGAAVVLAIAGCGFVSGIMSGFLAYPPSAYLWGFGAAAGYASYSIVAGILLKRHHPATVLFYAFLFAGAAGCLFADLGSVAKAVAAEPAAGLWLVCAAFVGNIFSYLCYNLALKSMEASRVAVVASVEPAVASVLGVVILGEHMDGFGVIGVLCIFGAILILNQPEKRGSNER